MKCIWNFLKSAVRTSARARRGFSEYRGKCESCTRIYGSERLNTEKNYRKTENISSGGSVCWKHSCPDLTCCLRFGLTGTDWRARHPAVTAVWIFWLCAGLRMKSQWTVDARILPFKCRLHLKDRCSSNFCCPVWSLVHAFFRKSWI